MLLLLLLLLLVVLLLRCQASLLLLIHVLRLHQRLLLRLLSNQRLSRPKRSTRTGRGEQPRVLVEPSVHKPQSGIHWVHIVHIL